MLFPTVSFAAASLALVATVSAQPSSSSTVFLSKRQDSGLPGGAEIPAACTDTCSSTLTLYQACESGDTATCLTICSQDNTNSLYNCLNCAFQNEEFTETQYNTLTATVATLTTSCSAVGQSNQPSSSIPAYSELSAIYATATFASGSSASMTNSGSASAASSSASVDASSASSSVATATSSLANAITSGASSASASASQTSTGGGIIASASSLGGSASSALASATSAAGTSGGEKTLALGGGFAGVLAGLGAIFLL